MNPPLACRCFNVFCLRQHPGFGPNQLQQSRDAKIKALEKAKKDRADAAKRAEQEQKQKKAAEKRALQVSSLVGVGVDLTGFLNF